MKKNTTGPAPLIRLFFCLLILAVGVGGFLVLKKMKRPPVAKAAVEQSLPIEVVIAQPVDFQVRLRGYGNVVAQTRVTLSAEVNGRVTTKRKHLLVGQLVDKGEVLFAIDSEEYQLDLDTAQSLLTGLSRDLEIARAEFERVDTLYQNNKVGSLSTVEKAETAVNTIFNQLEQVRQNKERARIQLTRCVIRAPFTGRVAAVDVEEDEYMTPGRNMITLVNDGALEVIVPIDSRDAAHWLRLDFDGQQDIIHWFARPKPVPCEVTWSENKRVTSRGVLDRIVDFDSKTRMMTIAIRLEQEERVPFPLVEGMFCRVTIPGRVLPQVYVIPRQAVSFTGTVYVVVDGRLQTRKVEVIREEEDSAIIEAGLAPGDKVITTRLENPLEQTLVRIMETGT